ncbi:substrate-binding periplasmic protein [Duganella aceris]|jgi:polar amino acid transport system substrate-binding protein|uniref:Transporter substrate-binding domain-containing protein n=1 Tax=Duganella aceris TaxID=2703883 RepID=A0ABX0FD34_9BURK|nr:transporter substrate-binding domain-containing protein [Duganella aceris]NGZ82762.1 transporter substrate-binding domain-containing protein [Duganella aceris]
MRHIILTFLLAASCAGASAGTAAPLSITTEHSPPSSMLGPDGVTGRETDKIREMMARTGTDYTIDLLPWKRAYMMAQKRGQTCVYSTSRTPEREALFKWVGPTDEAEWQFWGLADHEFPLKTIEDARKLRIGTYVGNASDDYLRSRGFNVDAVSNDSVNPQKLLLNRIDLWAVAMRTGPAPRQFGWSEKVVPLLVFNRVKVYLACNPAVPDELIDRLNAALAEMRRDGTMARLERKYDNWVPK